MLELGQKRSSWQPPVMKTIARDGEGIKELLDNAENHFKWLTDSGHLKEKGEERSREELFQIIGEKIEKVVIDKVDRDVIDELSKKVANKEIDPYTAANEILAKIGFKDKK